MTRHTTELGRLVVGTVALAAASCVDVSSDNPHDPDNTGNLVPAAYIVQVLLESHRRDIEENRGRDYDAIRVRLYGEDASGFSDPPEAERMGLSTFWRFAELAPTLHTTGYELRLGFDEDVDESCVGTSAFEPICTAENTVLDSGDINNDADPLPTHTLKRRRFDVSGRVTGLQDDGPALVALFTDCNDCDWNSGAAMAPRRWHPLDTDNATLPEGDFVITDAPYTLPGTPLCVVVRLDEYRPICEMIDPPIESGLPPLVMSPAGGELVAWDPVGGQDGAAAASDGPPSVASRLVLLEVRFSDDVGRNTFLRSDNLIAVSEPHLPRFSRPIPLRAARQRGYIGDIAPESCPLPADLVPERARLLAERPSNALWYCIQSPGDGAKAVDIQLTEPFGSRVRRRAHVDLREARASAFRLTPPPEEDDAGKNVPNRMSDGALWFDDSDEEVPLVLELLGATRPSAVSDLEILFCDLPSLPDVPNEDAGDAGPDAQVPEDMGPPSEADMSPDGNAPRFDGRCQPSIDQMEQFVRRGVCAFGEVALGEIDAMTNQRSVRLRPPPVDVGDGVRSQVGCAYLYAGRYESVETMTIRRINSEFVFGRVPVGASGWGDDGCRLSHQLRLEGGCPTEGEELLVGERPWIQLCGSVEGDVAGQPDPLCDYPFLYRYRVRICNPDQSTEACANSTGEWLYVGNAIDGETAGAARAGAGVLRLVLPFGIEPDEDRATASRRVEVDVVDRTGRLETFRRTLRLGTSAPALRSVKVITESNMGCNPVADGVEDVCELDGTERICADQTRDRPGPGRRCCQCLPDGEAVCELAYSHELRLEGGPLVRPDLTLPLRTTGLLDDADRRGDSARVCLAAGQARWMPGPDVPGVDPGAARDPDYTDAAPICRFAETTMKVPGRTAPGVGCGGQAADLEATAMVLRPWGRSCGSEGQAATLPLLLDAQPPILERPCPAPPDAPEGDVDAGPPDPPALPLAFPIRLRIADPGTFAADGALRARFVMLSAPLEHGPRGVLAIRPAEAGDYRSGLDRGALSVPVCPCEPPALTRRNADGTLNEADYPGVEPHARRRPDPADGPGWTCGLDAPSGPARLSPPPREDEAPDGGVDSGVDSGAFDEGELDAGAPDGGRDENQDEPELPPECYRVPFDAQLAQMYITREDFVFEGIDGGYLYVVVEDAVGLRAAYQLFHHPSIVDPEPEEP